MLCQHHHSLAQLVVCILHLQTTLLCSIPRVLRVCGPESPLYRQFHPFILRIPSVITDIHSQPLSKLYQTNGTTQHATMHLGTRLPQGKPIILHFELWSQVISGNVFPDLVPQHPAKLAMRPKPRISTHAQQKHVNNHNVMVGITGYPSKGHLHSNTSGWIPQFHLD